MKKIAVIVLLLALLSCGPDIKGPRTGSEGLLSSDGGSVAVSIDLTAYKELRQTFTAKDTFGTAALLMSGKVFLVPMETRVLVIDEDAYMKKVRIIEGKATGRAGWVPVERVRAYKAP